MIKMLTKLATSTFFLAHLVQAQPQWLGHFDGYYIDYKPPFGPYGCSNMPQQHFLTLDFEKKVYEIIRYTCHAGDWFYHGQRGQLQQGDGQAIKIQTELGFVEAKTGQEAIEWHPVKEENTGSFTFNRATGEFEEYDMTGKMIARWPARSLLLVLAQAPSNFDEAN